MGDSGDMSVISSTDYSIQIMVIRDLCCVTCVINNCKNAYVLHGYPSFLINKGDVMDLREEPTIATSLNHHNP